VIPCPTTTFPNLVRRRFAERLGEEFRSGACHAGRFETSIVLAARPAEVRVPAARGLPPNPRSLVEAMRAGHADFASAGGPRAYFGDPAAASREEGDESVRILGDILAEATLAALAAPAPGGDRSAAGDGST
jgi:creatinine amidohydrolase